MATPQEKCRHSLPLNTFLVLFLVHGITLLLLPTPSHSLDGGGVNGPDAHNVLGEKENTNEMMGEFLPIEGMKGYWLFKKQEDKNGQSQTRDWVKTRDAAPALEDDNKMVGVLLPIEGMEGSWLFKKGGVKPAKEELNDGKIENRGKDQLLKTKSAALAKKDENGHLDSATPPEYEENSDQRENKDWYQTVKDIISASPDKKSENVNQPENKESDRPLQTRSAPPPKKDENGGQPKNNDMLQTVKDIMSAPGKEDENSDKSDLYQTFKNKATSPDKKSEQGNKESDQPLQTRSAPPPKKDENGGQPKNNDLLQTVKDIISLPGK